MKTMKLLPLKIAVTSAMMVGLGVASTANAQDQSEPLEQLQSSIENKGQESEFKKGRSTQDKFNKYLLNSHYTNVLIAKELNDSINDLYDFGYELTDSLEKVREYNQQQTEAIDALNKASSANTDNIDKNKADIQNNIDNIYDLAQQQDRHAYDIQNLAKAQLAGVTVMEELNKNVESNTQKINNTGTLYENLSRTVGNNEKSIEKYKNDIDKHKKEADKNFEELTKNQNALIEQDEAQDRLIAKNQTDITANKTAIEQNVNRTVANGFEIEKNKAGIAANQQELIIQHDRLNQIDKTNNRQDQKIDQLGYALKEQGQHFNNRISAVERQTAGGIANAIAIATLPSPSRAGEHHILFGSGYHNGQAAVSLGAAGLSDTGKSTYKIGLSWSDAGGLSGGVGGSYRWK